MGDHARVGVPLTNAWNRDISGPDEGRSGGFERSGWATPLFDKETTTVVNEIYRRADAFLFGRRTFEIFGGSGGAMADHARRARNVDPAS
jgi:hypothetical protein